MARYVTSWRATRLLPTLVHSTECQNFSGSAFIVLIGIDTRAFKVWGAINTVANPTPSGAGYDANFRPNCATVIWAKYHFVPRDLIALRGSTLDDPNLAPPTYHIYPRKQAALVGVASRHARLRGMAGRLASVVRRSTCEIRVTSKSRLIRSGEAAVSIWELLPSAP
ncbi:MAG: GFA family protein [Pseudomonadota bacterium]